MCTLKIKYLNKGIFSSVPQREQEVQFTNCSVKIKAFTNETAVLDGMMTDLL